MIWGPLTIIVAVLQTIKGECNLLSLPKQAVCRATFTCTASFKDPSSALKSWDCIRRRVQRKYFYNFNYELFIELQNIDINKFENPLIATNITRIKNIKSLRLMEGNLVSLLPKIYDLKGLTQLVVVKNKIEKIDLIKLSYMSSLELVNASQNAISIIEDPNGPKKGSCKVHTIDLSYNKLQSIPDNGFTRFTRLLYLDLSHNLLNKINIRTFEGISQLETILLSQNQLTEIGFNFVTFTDLKKINLNHNYLKALYEINFKTLINLEHLDVSFNQIKTIEKNTFDTLIKLQELNLANNNIHTISKSYFKYNINLREFYISNNYIENIEPGVYEGKNISEFSIKGNHSTFTTSDYPKDIINKNVKKTNVISKSVTDVINNLFTRQNQLTKELIKSQTSLAKKNLDLLIKHDKNVTDLNDNRILLIIIASCLTIQCIILFMIYKCFIKK